ncbi:hypothetical protein OROGR_029732 [Orobanche gracilis]
MIMDAKDLQSDLHALTTLYGLLRKDGGEAPNTGSDSLDAHARALLKNLLDTATIRVLSALNSEVIAGQTKASAMLFPARLQQSDETLRPIAVEGNQSREKELDSDSRLTPDYWSQAGSVPAIVQKRCRLCRRDTVKQRTPTRETRLYDVAENSNIFAQNNVFSDHHHHHHLRNCVKEIGWLSGNVSNNFVYPMHQPLPPSVKKEERNQPYLSLYESYTVQPTKVIDSEEEFYSPSSGEGGHEVTSGSSKGYLSYEQPIPSYARLKHVSKQSVSNKSRPSRIKNAYNMNHNREYGILKRMKRIPEVHHHRDRGYQESDSTTCDSCSNSSSQQTSNSQYSRYRSNNEGEFYSSSRGDGAPSVTASSSSENEGYSSYGRSIGSCARPKHFLKRSTSRKSGASRIEKPYGISRTKHSGILKRMKDKLELIFHHHHHHHHHHHNRGDDSNDEENMSHNSSLNKHKGKAIDAKRKDDIYGAKAVEKIQKSQIREKRQNSNFLGLVGGVWRHIRHSKQSKPGKGTADRFAGEYLRKRTLKKSRQWKLLQHHGRSKLPNKSHMKFGLGKKKKHVLKSSLKDIE